MNGDLQANLEKADKVYGRCNNPNRQFSKIERDICLDKQRAAGPDGVVGDAFNITEFIEKVNNPKGNVIYSGSSVNQELWNGSLKVLSSSLSRQLSRNSKFTPDSNFLSNLMMVSTETASSS